MTNRMPTMRYPRRTSTVFYCLVILLMIDALIEMSFVAATVYFLHRRAGRSFQIAINDGSDSFSLHGKPQHELADQGHTSNGAAGTALILVGIGAFLTFPLFKRDAKTGRPTLYSSITTTAWLVMALLSMILTLAALIYTMVVTSQHSGQEIDEDLASRLNNRPYPDFVAYPRDSWTPENWFSAVLELDLVYPGDRTLIEQKLNIMRGWRWNLIPMFILGVAVFLAGLNEVRKQRVETGRIVGGGGVPEIEKIAMDLSKERDLESSADEGRVDIPMLQPVEQQTVVRKPLSPQQQQNVEAVA